jgi:hypothetical protein
MYCKRLDMLGRFALFAIILLWAQGSSASMIVYEPFDYADGSNLGGQSPDAGTHTWAQADTANASVDTKATSPGLSMPAYMAPAQGNKATYGAGTTSDRINLNGGITTGSTYYSFLLKVTDLGTLPTLNSGSGGNQILAGFNNSVGTQGPNPTNISSTIWAKPGPTGTGTGNDPNHYQLGMSVSAATTSRQYGSATYATTDTLFVVGQFQFGADTTYANANGNLWVYDLTAGDTVPFTPGTPTASPVGTGLSGSASLASFLLYSTAANTSNRFGVNGINVDEVRVGNSWNDVVVPEPSMLALIGLGMMGLFSLRLRNA